MKYSGTITQVRRSGADLTVIIDSDIGLRGLDLDRELWQAILADFELDDPQQLVGWPVEYDPSHGALDVLDPRDDADAGDDLEAATGPDGSSTDSLDGEDSAAGRFSDPD